MQAPNPDELFFIFDTKTKAKQLVRFEDLKCNLHKYHGMKIYHNIHHTQPVDEFIMEKLGLKTSDNSKKETTGST